MSEWRSAEDLAREMAEAEERVLDSDDFDLIDSLMHETPGETDPGGGLYGLDVDLADYRKVREGLIRLGKEDR